MSLYDIVGIANLVGVALMLVFFFPWGGRPPRNRMIGNVGFAMIVVAAVGMLALRLGLGL